MQVLQSQCTGGTDWNHAPKDHIRHAALHATNAFQASIGCCRLEYTRCHSYSWWFCHRVVIKSPLLAKKQQKNKKKINGFRWLHDAMPLSFKCNVLLSWLSSVFISTFFRVAFQNEELPSRIRPSPTGSDALSPRWQHIYIVAMDTTSITLCMAFTDLQIKGASLRVMSDEPARFFDTPCRNTRIAAVRRDGSRADTTIDGVSIAWPVGAWHEVCIKQACWPSDELF